MSWSNPKIVDVIVNTVRTNSEKYDLRFIPNDKATIEDLRAADPKYGNRRALQGNHS